MALAWGYAMARHRLALVTKYSDRQASGNSEDAVRGI